MKGLIIQWGQTEISSDRDTPEKSELGWRKHRPERMSLSWGKATGLWDSRAGRYLLQLEKR